MADIHSFRGLAQRTMAIDDLRGESPTVRSDEDRAAAGPANELPSYLPSRRVSSVSSFTLFSTGTLERDPVLLAARVTATNELAKALPEFTTPPVRLPMTQRAPPPTFDQGVGPQLDVQGAVAAAVAEKRRSTMQVWRDVAVVRLAQARRDVETMLPILTLILQDPRLLEIFQDPRRLAAAMREYSEERSLCGRTITLSYEAADDSSIGTCTHSSRANEDDDRKPLALLPMVAAPHREEASPHAVIEARPHASPSSPTAKSKAPVRRKVPADFDDAASPKRARTKLKSPPRPREQDDIESAAPSPREVAPKKQGGNDKCERKSHRSQPKEGGLEFHVDSVKDTELQPHILCRRGGGGNGHQTNKIFRMYCATRVAEYRPIRKQEKDVVAQAVLDSIHQGVGFLAPDENGHEQWYELRGARFLAKAKGDSRRHQHWYEIVDSQALEKVKQSLREA